jgi:hypothetical protein
MIPGARYNTKVWAVEREELEAAWFRYSNTKPPPNRGQKDYLIYSAFQFSFAQGWLRAQHLNPDYNTVTFV